MRQRPGAGSENLIERRKPRRDHSHHSRKIERGSWEIEVETPKEYRIGSTESDGELNTDYRFYPNAYKSSLSDYGIRDLRHKKPKKASPVIFTRGCCLNFCQFYSIVAFFFLLWVALLLDYQPLYIKGGLVKTIYQVDDTSRPITQYTIPSPQNRSDIAIAAYQASFAYLWVAVACFLALRPHLTHYWRRRLYRELADDDKHRGDDDIDPYLGDHLLEDDMILPHYYTTAAAAAQGGYLQWRHAMTWVRQRWSRAVRTRGRKKKRHSSVKKSG
jgi:hypothetical protein